MAAPGWPAELTAGRVGLRPLRLRDLRAWTEVRLRNEHWLQPWEATPEGAVRDWRARHGTASYLAMAHTLRVQARAGQVLPFVLTVDGHFAGQVTVGAILRGALNSGWLGYWVDERYAGHGVAPTGVALAADHCFGPVGLHRVEADIRPENAASLRVVHKLGFQHEGLHRRYLNIDGAYRDHLCYVLLREDVPSGGVLRQWLGSAGS